MTRFFIDNVQKNLDFSPKTPEERVAENAKNLLMTKMGEVPYDRLRGFDWRLCNLPIEKLRAELLPELDRVMLWEPRVRVEDADARLMTDGSVYISATILVSA